MKTLQLRNLIDRSLFRCSLIFIPLALALFALAPAPKAFGVSPAPDGGYAGNNTAEGTNALFSLTSGTNNTANGASALFHNTTGIFNTAIGSNALFNNTTGASNTANGVNALVSNSTGSHNTANGASALFHNTIGASNTANGYQALLSNTGSGNTAIGASALATNTTANNNTATGANALFSNTTGSFNTAYGFQALFRNTTGNGNAANGFGALVSNTTGFNNTANGDGALQSNTTAGDNTADGRSALANNTTGGLNTALGFLAGLALTTGSNNIHIGANVFGNAGEANTIRIGKPGLTAPKTFIAGIRGVTTVNANAVPVVIDSAGQLGTASSSRRFKKEIKPMDQTSEAIMALKPVTFHYKSDTKGTPQFGLIAEEVAKVDPDLVVRDDDGEIYTVRYDAVNAMLLNEFLKEHRKVEEQGRKAQAQEATITQLKKDFRATVAELNARLKEQDSKIEKVSAQVEASRPAPQTVANDQ